MPSREIEIVLMRQLASYLAAPILVVDRNRDLLFFNEPAEPILGSRFDETGEIQRGLWTDTFRPSDADGAPLPSERQPLTLAIENNEPTHRRLSFRGPDATARVMEGLAFPLEPRGGELLGGVGMFWEVESGGRDGPGEPGWQPEAPLREVEVILLRRLARRLTMPIIVAGPSADLLYYNPAAEPLMGRRFADLGMVQLGDWYDAFKPTDDAGVPIKPADHPLVIALEQHRPSFRRFWFQGLDGVKHRIEGTAFPLEGQCGRRLGVVGIFWEIDAS